ncbi:Cdc6/Cdc18 family protein [Halobacterium salinarum]|uniref:Cdc6/Cdc18 family protein n=1 Tax=Halobacterium salinarum TaxID=2242 RepID=UPI002554C5CB|nr:Cdc6/Cdc18 family protein [Halobacterium salinarum]MDL0133554.1 orc1/cdc6 family replication initiation protein [Halobacterium salinarum]
MFARHHVFDEGWVPEDLHSRNGELQALADVLDDLARGWQAPQPVLLSGPPGAGKTASARYVLHDLEETTTVRTALVDAWTAHKPYQTYAALLQELGKAGIVQPQTPHSVLRDRVRDATPDSGVVVVLDEADQLDDPGLLRDLDAMTGIAVVAIVNDEQGFRDRLDRTSSTVDWRESIPFGPYSERELVDILRPRASRGLQISYSRTGALQEVAARAQGNARVAIQGLRAAAEHAHENGQTTIQVEDVEAGIEAAVAQIRRKTRSRLQRHERIVFEVLAELGESRLGEVYEAYRDRIGDDANGRGRVSDYLGKLASYNLVAAEGEKRGRTYRVVASGRTELA